MNWHGRAISAITALFVWMLATGPPAWSQSGQVYPGQTTTLSVVPEPGYTYAWQLYTDVEGQNLVQIPGNCPSASALFEGDATGSSVEVTWLKAGTYYYKVQAVGSCSADNVKIGRVTVSDGIIIQGEIDLIAQRIVECSMQTLSLPILVTGFDSVSSFRLQLSYDASIIEYLGISDPQPGLLEANVHAVELSPGILNITYHDPDILQVPDGNQLMMLQFNGKQHGLTNLTWDFLECTILNADNDIMPIRAMVHGIAEILESPGVVALHDTALCAGDSMLLRAVSSFGGPINYVWSHGMQNHTGAQWNITNIQPNEAGAYVVKAINMYCESTDTVDITVHPDAALQIAYADTIFFSMPFTLDAQKDYADYLWNNGSTAPSLTVYEPGIYTLHVVDYTGCPDTDSIVMMQASMAINIPNAFTPDGDGLNDTFKPEFIGFEPLRYRMEIYNKWGQLVFSTTDTSQGWDGTIEGKETGPEVFVYTIAYNVPPFVIIEDKTNPIRGTVMVVK